jgi:hypothetical protein
MTRPPTEGTSLVGASPKRPDITPAQIVAGIPIIASLLRAFGVYDLSKEEQDALSDATTWAMALVGADALIRVGRNLAAKVRA